MPGLHEGGMETRKVPTTGRSRRYDCGHGVLPPGSGSPLTVLPLIVFLCSFLKLTL